MAKYGDLRRTLAVKLQCQQVGAKELKYRLFIDGKLFATTSLPKEKGHGKSEIGKGLFHCIANQLRLTDAQLNDIVRSVASRPEYIKWARPPTKGDLGRG